MRPQVVVPAVQMVGVVGHQLLLLLLLLLLVARVHVQPRMMVVHTVLEAGLGHVRMQVMRRWRHWRAHVRGISHPVVAVGCIVGFCPVIVRRGGPAERLVGRYIEVIVVTERWQRTFLQTIGMLLHVLGKVGFLRVRLPTELAYMRLEVLRLLVLGYVLQKSRFVSETFVAAVALVGLVGLVASRVGL